MSFFCRTSRTRSRKRMRTRSTRASSALFPDISSHGTAFGRSRDCGFSGVRYDFFGPDANRLVHHVELLCEEVIRAGDDDALRVAHLRDELLELLDRSVFVFRAVQKKDRAVASAQVAEIVFVDRRADQKNAVDLWQLARHAGRDPGTE